MLPAHLIEDFWDTVSRELHKRDFSDKDVNLALSRYRSALNRHEVGDWIYHRNPETVAETIALGWKTGFPDPQINEPR